MGAALCTAGACGGSAFSSNGDGDGDSAGDGDGDGDPAGDGDGDDPNPGDGDGDGPLINFGIEGVCDSHDDCTGVWVTSAPCYSGDCSAPVAASYDDIVDDPCLVEWSKSGAPAATEDCRYDSDGDIACPAACAQPPSCIAAICNDASRCEIEFYYDAIECSPGGTGGSGAGGSGTGGGSSGSCDDLDAARESALSKARSCVFGGIVAECTEPAWVSNECGCQVAVNNVRPEDIQAAEDAYDAWNEACEPPMYCQLVDCIPPTGSTDCEIEEGSVNSVCVFQ